jgi:hypothetical protein
MDVRPWSLGQPPGYAEIVLGPCFLGPGRFLGSRGSGPGLQGGAPTLCSPSLIVAGSVFVSKPGSVPLSVKVYVRRS